MISKEDLKLKNGKQLVSYFKYKAFEQIRKDTDFLDESVTISERIYCFMNDINEIQLCNCKNKLKFHKLNKGYFKTCGKDECVKSNRVKSIETTMILKYGMHTSTLNETKEKIKITLKERYGDENYVNFSLYKETLLERYGIDSPLKNKEFLEKKQNTQFEKYGNKNYNNRNQIEKTNLKKYGYVNPAFNDKIKEKTLQTFKNNTLERINNDERVINFNLVLIDSDNAKFKITCNSCQSSFVIRNGSFNKSLRLNKNPCYNCNPILKTWSSNMEKELFEYIKTLDDSAINRFRLKGIEIDVYSPMKNIGFEFNGLYWHSEVYKSKTYHQDKKLHLLELGTEIIHIYEDEWMLKKDIVKSIIASKLGKTIKIFARKCEIKIIDSKLSSNFLNDNHIQGKINALYHLGLFYNNQLVSVMSFGKYRKNLGRVFIENEYELLRFCNLKNTTIIGGASKLFSFFKNQIKPNKILSYASFDRSTGKLYETLNFKKIHLCKPNYWYVINGKKHNRFKFRKDILIKNGYDANISEKDIMSNLGIIRLYDSGSILYEWNN